MGAEVRVPRAGGVAGAGAPGVPGAAGVTGVPGVPGVGAPGGVAAVPGAGAPGARCEVVHCVRGLRHRTVRRTSHRAAHLVHPSHRARHP